MLLHKMNKKQKWKISGLVALILSLSTLLYTHQLQREQQQELQNLTIQQLKTYGSCNSNEIPLDHVVRPPFSEVCIQPPYMPKEDFENLTKKRVKGYNMTMHDGAIVWWIFTPDESAVQIEMLDKFMVAAPEVSHVGCIPTRKTNLVFECKSEKIFYNFRK